jgi:hypothetical protein
LTFSCRIEASLIHTGTTNETTDSYVITASRRKITQISSFSAGFGLSSIACICYKTQTYIHPCMNTPYPGPIIEVRSERSVIEDQEETPAPREVNAGVHPFGSALLRLELVLALISFSRRQNRPAKAKARIRKAR